MAYTAVYDAQSQGRLDEVAAGTHLLCSHVVADQPNRMLFVTLSTAQVMVLGAGATVAGVTYNGAPLTLMTSVGTGALQLWYLIAPDIGTHDIEVEVIDGGDPGDTLRVAGGGESLHSAKQAAPASTTTANGSSTAPSVNYTGTDTGAKVMDTLRVVQTASSALITAGAGQTKKHDIETTNSGTKISSTSSIEDSAVGTVTMSYTLGTSKAWRIMAWEVLPAQQTLVDPAEMEFDVPSQPQQTVANPAEMHLDVPTQSQQTIVNPAEMQLHAVDVADEIVPDSYEPPVDTLLADAVLDAAAPIPTTHVYNGPYPVTRTCTCPTLEDAVDNGSTISYIVIRWIGKHSNLPV